MENLLDNLKNLLQKDERLVSEGELLKNKVIELALKLDKDLIKLLLSDEKMKEVFFIDVDKTLIFDKDKFIKFVSNKQFLPDSYTAFKNKIGLIDGDGEFISQKKEVVLSWPYKDCVLEGGMTKEDQKRDEIFWNETLAPDEITRLLDPKVFTNFKRIDKDGEHSLDEFKKDEKGDIKDNLIIKGNNLLALHSLKKRFAGKVKLIYIDPPYNTGNDEFKYNDSFNHSSWLVFMKNRLQTAKALLNDEGVIFVQCDDNEQAYLRVLMDEIFARENFVNCIAVKMAESTGVKMSHTQKKLSKIKEYLLVYKKNKISFNAIRLPKEKWDSEYRIFIDNVNQEDVALLKNIIENKNRTQDEITQADKICKEFRLISLSEAIKKYSIPKSKFEDWRQKNAWRIIRTVATVASIKKLADYKKNKLKQFVFTVISPENKMYVVKSDYNEKEEQPRIKIIFADNYLNITLGDFWWDVKTTGLESEGSVSLLHGKKPEQLIQRIVNMSTEEGEIVLDYHLGTGTTCAVAHKMGRQYIGIEQLDYGENSAVVRLKNVIKGDQTGISKSVGWQGGGDFVYLELAKWNENFVEKIQKAKTKDELNNIWETMKEKAFLSYKVDIKSVDENAKDFEDLSIEDQKRFLLECLDKNHLYVNYSEIDDEEYGVCEEDKKLNKEFYG